MLKQTPVTENAEAVLHFLPSEWTTPGDISRITGMAMPCCQLILTQLPMAGLAEDKSGEGNQFRRCEYSR
ncbi:hypothetical protein [Erwinia psidii]|uniref:MarR family transcriptional regulator n=1 Tax=Erwinia psidii TaxID=69224 RepID=A0A3N6SJ70_9GAMM|nr:hypothetical protein [Erwinia psidii]MCX8955813.1 hypothetical protein [Erwinia psidii]MCX8961630.1 hypothetical protein [Erwinia psidii]MCX8965730.1 hypothetical protein [Erwinia psidii]RQM37646.1 hypothetical protein EB241_14050 [Erwinia psidii]